jgi:hypothetical protein
MEQGVMILLEVQVVQVVEYQGMLVATLPQVLELQDREAMEVRV